MLFDIVVSVFPDDGSNLGYKSAGISRLMSWRIRGLSCLGGIKIWKASIDCFVVCYGDVLQVAAFVTVCGSVC